MARNRRSGDEVRAAILAAAARLFLARGYEATGTKAIAQMARVQEPLIYRHFGNKAGLLRAAVQHALVEFVQKFERQPSRRGGAFVAETARFTRSLYRLLARNRELLIALFAASRSNSLHRGVRAHDALAPMFDRLAANSRPYRRRGGLDPAVGVRLTFGLIASTVVLDDWLFPARGPAARAGLGAALEQYVVGGSTSRRRGRSLAAS